MPLIARLRDILQLRFTAIFAGLPASVLATISPASPLKRLARVVGYMGLRLIGNVFKPIQNADQLHGAVWLYVVSANNYEALEFVKQTRPEAVLLAGQGKNIGRYNKTVNRLSLRRKLLYYWQYPVALIGLLKTEGHRAWRFFDLIFYAVGYYEVYRRALRHYQPRAVIFANDHNDDTRSLLLACRAEGISTAYVQHASVSTNFPPLGFDLSLLEGQDALDKYRQCGPVHGRVELVGMPKADAYLARRNTAPQVRRVGLACNIHDPLPAITETLEYLAQALPALVFTLRPHPSDTRDFGPLRQLLPALQWSDARRENVFEFLAQQDALVAADTSTHLEATLLNVASIYYRFGNNPLTNDYYGYASRGLVPRAGTLADLAELLRQLAQHKPADLYRRAAYYNATLGTADEGHSQQLASRVLAEWLTVQQGLGLKAEIEAQLGRPLWFPNATVTIQERLDYVLIHFMLAYPNTSSVTIGYTATQPQVEVAELGNTFFEEDNPYPNAPNWRDWAGQRIPFFFDQQPDEPLLTLSEGHAHINADIISAAFYLLSGWQEYFSEKRDWHGRFPYASSVQKQYGFVTQPVVNYYFDVLKTAIEHVTGQPLHPRRWAGGAPFAAFITHDIDNLNGGWGTAARHALRHGHYGTLLKLLVRRATGHPAPWNNLETVQAATARYGAPSTFFMLGSNAIAPNGTRNADYNFDQPDLRPRLAALAKKGAEIATHGSYGTARDVQRLRQEKVKLAPLPVAGNRFHYLSWEPRSTPAVVAEAGFQYDSTLGFAEHFGFRNSYCLPFFPWDFASSQAFDFLEIPLNVMDATLHNPNYLQLRADEIMPAVQPMLEEIKRFGGVATVLWHNENFDPLNTLNGPAQLAEILAYLQQQGAQFVTGADLCAEFTQPTSE